MRRQRRCIARQEVHLHGYTLHDNIWLFGDTVKLSCVATALASALVCLKRSRLPPVTDVPK